MCDEEGKIVYLHRLIAGNVESSFAHQVAESCGLEHDLIQRSLKVRISAGSCVADVSGHVVAYRSTRP